MFNSLNENCLLSIFEHLDTLDDLINFSSVYSQWSPLIKRRLSKVKYLLSVDIKCGDPKLTVYVKDSTFIVTFNIHEFLPNLEMLDCRTLGIGKDYEKFIQIMEKNPKIKGIIFPPIYPILISPTAALRKIEMLVADDDPELHKIDYPHNLTQLTLFGYGLRLSQYEQHFNSLKRLSLRGSVIFDVPQNSSLLPNLTILELFEQPYCDGYSVYDFLNLCPSLQSAFLCISARYYSPNTKEHQGLRDLVIQASRYCDWSSWLVHFISKFPKLEHFAFRVNHEIDDHLVEELIDALPNIKLMDFRMCPLVSRRGAHYAEKKGRSIEFLTGAIDDFLSDYQHNFEICSGSDFMKNCFFKQSDQLPILLDDLNAIN